MAIKVTSWSFSRHPKLRQALLSAFPDAGVNDIGRTLTSAEMIAFIGNAEGVVISTEPFGEAVLAACPKLKIVSKFGVGLDNLDVEACKRRGVAVGWTGGTNKRSVAEMDLCFMLAMARNLYPASLALKKGAWNKNGGVLLSGKTVGIIGLGHTGSEIVRLLEPFGCILLGNDIVDKRDFCRQHRVREATKDEIYRDSDIVTLHVPLTDDTRGLINSRTLALMKPTAYVINTARGPVVNQADLKRALIDGVIAGAAIDVFEEEPATDLDLLKLPNLFCTPHIGGNADEAVVAMGMSAIHHLIEYFEK